MFRKKRPGYGLKYFDPHLMIERALRELEDQIEQDRVILTTGCCQSPTCVTTVFIGCILEGIDNSHSS